MAFTLPDLPFAPDALEPHFDARTMEIHHGKHHAAYVSKANAALEGTSLEGKSPEDVIKHLAEAPTDKQGAIRNNAGGHVNHSLFWQILAPAGSAPTGGISSELSAAIDAACGSMEGFQKAFATAATGRFGSGWAWLCTDPDGTVHVTSTANQDNPMMSAEFGGEGEGHTPILGLDVWEHAYYLNYQNRRPDYVTAFWNVVNWEKVSELYAAAKS
ncbi:MAG: superoxide dismutase [Planctomycetota bacterium]